MEEDGILFPNYFFSNAEARFQDIVRIDYSDGTSSASFLAHFFHLNVKRFIRRFFQLTPIDPVPIFGNNYQPEI